VKRNKTTFGLHKGRVLTDDELLALAGMQPKLATSEDAAQRGCLADALEAAEQAAWMCLLGFAFVMGFAGGLALV
jgi:hypothetical protein